MKGTICKVGDTVLGILLKFRIVAATLLPILEERD